LATGKLDNNGDLARLTAKMRRRQDELIADRVRKHIAATKTHPAAGSSATQTSVGLAAPVPQSTVSSVATQGPLLFPPLASTVHYRS
jgi:hypothetical protein